MMLRGRLVVLAPTCCQRSPRAAARVPVGEQKLSAPLSRRPWPWRWWPPGERQRRNGVLPESPPDFGVTAEMGR